MPSMAERRRTMADYAVPTPRSANGCYIDLRLSLYADGHGYISPEGDSNDGTVGQPIPDDYVMIAELAKLIGQLRARQQRARRNAA